MNLHYFKEQHALELPPFGASHIDLGELVWKEPFRRPNWLDNGLPKNIFNCFLHFDLLDEEQRKKQQKKVEQSPLKPAAFTDRIVSTNRRYSRRFPHPIAVNINEFLKKKQQHTYYFSRLEMKEINLYWRKEIEAQLKQIRQQTYRLYRRYDPVYMVTQVHYGALHFSPRYHDSKPLQDYIEKSLEDGSLHCCEGKDKATVYRFAHQNIPFAVKLENINTFKANIDELP